jgi:hypothetical protein
MTFVRLRFFFDFRSTVTGHAARPIIKLKHAQTLNTDRTRPFMQRPHPVTSVTSVRLRFFSDFRRNGK